MPRTVSFILLITLVPVSFGQQPAATQILGFTPATAQTEHDWEEKVKAIPDPQRMRAAMEKLSARPHHVGSPYDKENAEWILSQYKEWGWDAHIETFQVLLPTPKSRLLELTAPTKFTAKLEEPAVANDPTSKQKDEQLPTYNAYSPDGNVTGPLVYVNYGRVEDYEELARHGVSVQGAIAIARYGKVWRGIKPKLAAEHGAVGCLIYSDPADDGFSDEKTFPAGPMRPDQGVQRGSVLDMPQYPGDPLTPGVGATADAQRLKREEAPTIPKIPVLPISYGDAQPLLAAMEGPVAPEKWRGALPITYHLGSGPAKVHLQLAFNWDLKPVYDVIATMRGSQEADLWVIRANHHDAWVNGAEDPVSGQVALLEEARALGELAKSGWKPKRTIIYASWDGEEPMLLGSTEWAEQHAKELAEHAAVYINSDGNDRGFLTAQGSNSLESLITGIAKDVTDPETNVSAWKRLQAKQLLDESADVRADARSRANLRLGSLGSGSDYSSFFDHLGIASLNIAFEGEDRGGIYHSIYDDFYWYTHFSDSTFVYGRALAQTGSLAVMRMADSDLLPYDFAGLADTVRKYTTEVKTLFKNRREEAEARKKNLDDDVYKLADDPKHPMVPPPSVEIPPYLNFAPLDNALDALDKAAEHYTTALSAFNTHPPTAEQLPQINQLLALAERKLTSPQGLPRRPWMHHLLDAPGWYTGYGAKTLPGVREAIEERRYSEAEAQIQLLAGALQDEAAYIDSCANRVAGGSQPASASLSSTE